MKDEKSRLVPSTEMVEEFSLAQQVWQDCISPQTFFTGDLENGHEFEPKLFKLGLMEMYKAMAKFEFFGREEEVADRIFRAGVREKNPGTKEGEEWKSETAKPEDYGWLMTVTGQALLGMLRNIALKKTETPELEALRRITQEEERRRDEEVQDGSMDAECQKRVEGTAFEYFQADGWKPLLNYATALLRDLAPREEFILPVKKLAGSLTQEVERSRQLGNPYQLNRLQMNRLQIQNCPSGVVLHDALFETIDVNGEEEREEIRVRSQKALESRFPVCAALHVDSLTPAYPEMEGRRPTSTSVRSILEKGYALASVDALLTYARYNRQVEQGVVSAMATNFIEPPATDGDYVPRYPQYPMLVMNRIPGPITRSLGSDSISYILLSSDHILAVRLDYDVEK